MHRVLRRLVVGSVLLVGCSQAPSSQSKAAAPADTPALPVTTARDEYDRRTGLLMSAAEKGQVSLVLELLQKGGNPNDKDDAGDTALHKAAAKGQRSAVAVLLVKGADAAERDAKGRTPAMRAAENGHADVLGLLLDPQKVMTMAGDVLAGLSLEAAGALAGDVGKKVSSRLYDGLGTSREATDALGQTALMKAAANGHLDCVRQFLNNSTRLNARDKQGRSAVMLAAQNGHPAVVEALAGYEHYGRLTFADLAQADHAGATAVQLATFAGHNQAVGAVRRALLLAAAREGDVKYVREHVNGADAPGERVMVTAAERGQVGVVRMLLDQWKDKPADDKLRLLGTGFPDESQSGTALHKAILAGSLPAVEALTDLGWWKDKAVLADYLGRKGFNGQTPLQWAGNSWHTGSEKAEIVALLKKRTEEVKK